MNMDNKRLNPNDVESSVLKVLISEVNALRNDVNQLHHRVGLLSYQMDKIEERLADDERDIEDLMKW